MLKNPNLLRKNSKARLKSLHQRGFTLVEILVVVAIISVLMTAVGPVFNSLSTSQSPAAAASVVAGQLERARSHAIAKNTYVWVRLGEVSDPSYANEFFMGVFESVDGTATGTTRRVWKSPRLPNFSLSNFSPNTSASTLARPAATQTANLAAWVRISPAGEAIYYAASAGDNSLTNPPAPPALGQSQTEADRIQPWTEFGLQATRRGGTIISNDVAAVQLNGLTGQTLKFYR